LIDKMPPSQLHISQGNSRTKLSYSVAFATHVSDTVQILILCTVACGSVLICYPLTRSAWTVLVYLSGGIERPHLRAIPGRKKAS